MRAPKLSSLTVQSSAPDGTTEPEEAQAPPPQGLCFTWSLLRCPLALLTPREPGTGPWGEYLAFEEETTFLRKLAERVRATSVSGTSTTTCGLRTKPRPLCTPTHKRRSKISRALPSSGPPA